MLTYLLLNLKYKDWEKVLYIFFSSTSTTTTNLVISVCECGFQPQNFSRSIVLFKQIKHSFTRADTDSIP